MSKFTVEEKLELQIAWRQLNDAQQSIRKVIDSSQDIPALDKLASVYEHLKKQKVRLSKMVGSK